MAYAQTNYSQIQGINGRYTIHDIGCFLTSFCNLLQRYGESIDPPTLNNYFVAHDDYIDVDDGVRDDLAWGTISSYDGTIHPIAIGTGVPSGYGDNVIVKFAYNSFQTGRPTTHFCLVQSVANGTIIDSWDGQVKSWNSYPGGPKEWAAYSKTNLQGATSYGGQAMNHNAGTEAYVTVFHRNAESGAAADQWNGESPEGALKRMRDFAEWQSIDSKVKNYDSLAGQIATLISNPSKADLQAAVDQFSAEHAKVADLEAQVEAEKNQPVVSEQVAVKSFFSRLIDKLIFWNK